MSKIFGSCSSKSGSHALEDEEYIEKRNNLVNWKMPKISVSKIYHTKRFVAIFGDPTIKSNENQISFGNRGGFIKLITEVYSPYYKDKILTKLNVGMIQVGVKTLTRKIPAAASITLCIRDNRIERTEDSILALVKTNLSEGPFYFNLFPNITLPLFDNFLPSMLTLNILVNGFDQLPEDSDPFLLTYRTYYKLNENSFGQEALLESPEGKTTFFQTDIQGWSSDVVQKTTKWDQVKLPKQWPPLQERVTPKIVENPNGTVNISFNNSNRVWTVDN